MTYSIVARDPATGQLGVAVQSHWFSVGSVVTWARTGVGAVATQANAEISYGPRLLELLAAGAAPDDALSTLLAEDASAASRQVAVVDSTGATATHTGPECIPFAGHVTGASVSCQANIMVGADVWPAMLEAYERTQGSLATRLLAALDAAEAAGGDQRGRQSAAILVVPAQGAPWERVIELRVEDHPEPLPELRRLVNLHHAYTLAEEGDALIGEGRHEEAAAKFEAASALAPENHELLFWAGLGAAEAGDLDTALARVRRAIELQPGWRALLPRLGPETAPAAARVLALIER